MTSQAVLSLGSNLADPVCRIGAVAAAARADKLLLAGSSVYRTAPWGGVEQNDFYNAIVLISWPGTPRGLLGWCQDLEQAADRTRELRWGPRTLDVDVVAMSNGGVDCVVDEPDVIIPHPRAAQRAFVIVPWMEVQPQARLGGVALTEVRDALPASEIDGVHRLSLPLCAPDRPGS